MDENGKTPRRDYSVEEILAEARISKSREKVPVPRPDRAQSPDEEVLRGAQKALNMEAGAQHPGPEDPGGTPAPPEGESGKKRRFSWLRRKKKKQDGFREEEDLYYGLQLRPLEEYRKEYEKTVFEEPKSETDRKPEETGKTERAKEDGPGGGAPEGPKFGYLFDRDQQGPEEQGLDETVRRIHRERGERLRKVMEKAGLDPEEILPREEPSGRPEVPAPRREPEVPAPERPAPQPPVTPGPRREPEPSRPAPGRVPPPPSRPGITMGRTPDAEGVPGPAARVREEDAGALKTEERPPAPVREPVPKPPEAKDEGRTPPPETEPEGRTPPQYRCGGAPIHVIRPTGLRELLAAEAAAHPAAKPEPIPFPQRPAPEPPAPGNAAPPGEDGEARRPAGSGPEPSPTVPEKAEGPPAPPIPLHGGEDEGPRPPEHKKKFRLFGSEEETEPPEEPEAEQEELDDYTDPSDAPSVRNELLKNVTRLLLRLAVTGLSAVLMTALGILAEHPSALPPALHRLAGGPYVAVVQLVFLTVAAAFSYPALWNGVKGLTTFRANADSAVAVAVLSALIQTVLLLAFGVPQGFGLYAPLVAAALFLNAAGKLSMARRILLNFRYVSSPEQRSAVRIYDDYNTAIKLAQDRVLGEPCIAYQSKASFLRNFLSLSYAPDPAERVSQVLAPVGFVLSLALCVGCAFRTGSAVSALTAFAASCCVCAPMANMLCANLPVSRLSGLARRSGSMISGWEAVRRLSEVNAVMLDAQDLFPRGTVILNGIRTFAGQRIDDAILDAAALMGTVGGPLADLFDQIIKSRREILPKVGETAYEDGGGVVGTVSGRQILVGGRELLKAHGIEPPSRDYERKYLQSGRKLVYLASGGELVAMFLVTYRSDLRRSQELRRMERSGICLIVRTSDPNVTPRLISECFGVEENSVSVLPEKLGKVYADLVSAPPGRADALLATKGRPFAMIRLLTGCVRQRGNVVVAVALQAAAVALGFALVAFLSLYSGLSQLSLTALTIYEAFWTAAILLVPRFRSP
mgnify:CR=1 FL=1